MKKTIVAILLLGILISCIGNSSDAQMNGTDLRKSIHLSKCHAYHLIANGHTEEGIGILDSLWQTYHLDYTILSGIAAAYYKIGKRDSAFMWLQMEETYIDSMLKCQPTEALLRDKLPLTYLLKGKEAAKKVEASLSEELRQMARDFFDACPTPEDFLNSAVTQFFEAYKDSNYVR